MQLRQLVHDLGFWKDRGKYPITVSDTHKYVWFRVARCGTRTIKALLEDLEERVLPRAARFATFDAARYVGHFKFAFVRNPYDRLVSCYFMKVSGFRKNRLWLRGWTPDMSFGDFVRCVCATPDWRADRHIRSQHTLIDLDSLDYLGRVEAFRADVAKVMQRLTGRPAARVPHLNRTDREHYSHYYDEESRALVGARFSEDLRLLGYDFERPQGRSERPAMDR